MLCSYVKTNILCETFVTVCFTLYYVNLIAVYRHDLVCLNTIPMCKVLFTILWHCCTHWPCWLHTWCGPCDPSSLTKMLISQSMLCTFASAFTLVTLALCVTECRRTLKGTFKSFSFKNYIKLWCSSSNIPLGCVTIIEIWGENVLENTKKNNRKGEPSFCPIFWC